MILVSDTTSHIPRNMANPVTDRLDWQMVDGINGAHICVSKGILGDTTETLVLLHTIFSDNYL